MFTNCARQIFFHHYRSSIWDQIILRHRRLFKRGQTARKTQYYKFFVCRSLGGNDRNDKQKTRVKSSENNETLNKNSRNLWRTLKPSFFDEFPLYRAVKALHLQAIMTLRDKVMWPGVIVRLLIAQWCSIKKSSVFLLLNMHIIRSSWQMLYFQCLIIRFYRFSLILPKRKKNNYLSPHFMPLSVWNFWPWIIITIMIKIILNYYYLFSAIIHSKYFPNSDWVKALA